MSMILVFDTETTGFVEPTLPPGHPSQPKLVQLGCVLMTDEFREVAAVDLTVRPDGYTIPDRSSQVHGITTSIAHETGIPLANVLGVFAQLRANAVECVAFNTKFDRLVMEAAFARHGRQPTVGWPDKLRCCMEEATPIMALPPTARMKAAGFDKFKPPSLAEAYRHFCGKLAAEDMRYPWLRSEDGGFAGAHSALVDCRATVEVLLAMKGQGEAVPF
jgi:DNA polymerase-3 subunit epsilon